MISQCNQVQNIFHPRLVAIIVVVVAVAIAIFVANWIDWGTIFTRSQLQFGGGLKGEDNRGREGSGMIGFAVVRYRFLARRSSSTSRNRVSAIRC